MYVCVSGGGSLSSLLLKGQTASHFVCGPGNYKQLAMTAWLQTFSPLRDTASASMASLDLLLKAICQEAGKPRGLVSSEQ